MMRFTSLYQVRDRLNHRLDPNDWHVLVAILLYLTECLIRQQEAIDAHHHSDGIVSY